MKNIILALAVMLLAACGGGGGGGDNGTPTPIGTSVNLAPFKGVSQGSSTGAQYSFPALFGTDSLGRAWSGSFTVIADGATTFEGQNVTKRRSFVTLQLAGQAPVSETTTSYFLVSDGSPYKAISSSGVTYTPTSIAILPSTAKVGDSGNLSSSSGTDGTTSTATWSLNADFNGASILSLASLEKTGATVTAAEIDSFFLDAAGTPTKLVINVTTSGITVTLSGNIL